MAVHESPIGVKPQFVLDSGLPAVGNKLFFYSAGSSTKQSTFTDSTGLAANSNPITLNSLGEPDTQIWFTAGLFYKVVYAPSNDTDPPTSPIWTIDNLRGINDATLTVDQWQDSGFTPTFLTGATFSVLGDQTSIFQRFRRLKILVSAGTVYGYVSASVFGAVTTVTVVLDAGVLDAGLSAVAYGVVTPQNTSIPENYATYDDIQSQAYVSGTTGGSSTAYTLTLSPAITALATNQAVFVTFHTASGATPTLSINGLTAKALKYRDGAGTKQAVTALQIPSGWTSRVFDDGTNYVVVNVAFVPIPAVQAFLGANVNLNNTANYFNVVNTGSIGAANQIWLITAEVCLIDTAGAAAFLVRIWDGTTVHAETTTTSGSVNFYTTCTIQALVTLAGATTFNLSCKDTTSTSGVASTTGLSGTANKATSITAIRLA